MIRRRRPPIDADTLAASWLDVTELLGRDRQVMAITQVARVRIDIEATQRQRHCVIDDGSLLGPAFSQAQFAEARAALQPALPVTLPCPSAHTLDGYEDAQVKLAFTAHIAACS